jgi:hypothetical protein
MSQAARRIDALERHTMRDVEYIVWRQDETGKDAYTSLKHPGVVLTRAELADRVEPPGGVRIIVERVST